MTVAEEPVPKSGLAAEELPDYVVSGTWTMDDSGRWSFSDGKRTYAGEWAAVRNPYADPAAGQKEFDWFRFDGMGFLVCGWYTDPDGSTYYLNPRPDGTKGRMFTGWNWIRDDEGNEFCFYFNEKSDGTRGALWHGGRTPDGYETDSRGRWIEKDC